MNARQFTQKDFWPVLPWEEWQETCFTLHMWSQVIGKIRLALAPMLNHWWQVPLYLTPRGLTTSPLPYAGHVFQIDFDLLAHELQIQTSWGSNLAFPLPGLSVAAFYDKTMAALALLGIEVDIWTTPVEVPERIPFERNQQHTTYHPEFVQRFFRVLLQSDRLFKEFRARFLGKVSPVHFFWGAFDLAVTRFSGRRAPDHPGVPNVARYVMVEAYSHEVSSCGFWPGAGLGEPAYYSYAYPEPEGFKDYPVWPPEAYYHHGFGEFILPYEAVRTSLSPDETLLGFLQSTYEAAAKRARWDRDVLERQ